MLPFKLEQGKALLAWKFFTETQNEQQPVVERKRILKKTGKEQVFYTQNKAFKQTVTATGERLIKLYVRAYERTMAAGFRPESEQDLPPLFINATKLAKQCNASDRTMRNHIRRLRKVGLISKYVFHGTHHDFELCITPRIMFATNPTQVTDLLQETQNAAVPLSECTNFPLNVARDTSRNLEKEIRHVDKLGVAEPQDGMPSGDATSYTLATSLSGNTGPQQAPILAESRPTGALKAKSLETGAGGAADLRKQPVNPVFRCFVESFWAYARHVIYPHLDFDETQDKLAKNAIWSGVYLGFSCGWSESQWEVFQQELMERLDLAGTFYRNHPDKYPPMPYAEYVPGTGYFDRENPRGFGRTLQWLAKTISWKHQQRISDALRRAKVDFSKYAKGKAPKRLQEKSPLQLFKFHENRIRPLGAEALRKFYLQHAIPTK